VTQRLALTLFPKAAPEGIATLNVTTFPTGAPFIVVTCHDFTPRTSASSCMPITSPVARPDAEARVTVRLPVLAATDNVD